MCDNGQIETQNLKLTFLYWQNENIIWNALENFRWKINDFFFQILGTEKSLHFANIFFLIYNLYSVKVKIKEKDERKGCKLARARRQWFQVKAELD